jgi:hypothetical protein
MHKTISILTADHISANDALIKDATMVSGIISSMIYSRNQLASDIHSAQVAATSVNLIRCLQPDESRNICQQLSRYRNHLPITLLKAYAEHLGTSRSRAFDMASSFCRVVSNTKPSGGKHGQELLCSPREISPQDCRDVMLARSAELTALALALQEELVIVWQQEESMEEIEKIVAIMQINHGCGDIEKPTVGKPAMPEGQLTTDRLSVERLMVYVHNRFSV